jgi:pyruvate formate lyase activating enzyme
MQAEFFSELAVKLKAMGLHIALDTSLSVWNDKVRELIDRCDLILADLKFTTEEEYTEFCGGSLTEVLSRLEYVNSLGKEIWIRHVVVPGITDTREDIIRLKELIKPYRGISRVELLPFRKLCLEKYGELGIPFPLSDTPEATGKVTRELYGILNGTE